MKNFQCVHDCSGINLQIQTFKVQYMIEVMFQIRKDKFKDHPALIEELDKIEEDEQFTHLVTLEDPLESQDMLSKFCDFSRREIYVDNSYCIDLCF